MLTRSLYLHGRATAGDVAAVGRPVTLPRNGHVINRDARGTRAVQRRCHTETAENLGSVAAGGSLGVATLVTVR